MTTEDMSGDRFLKIDPEAIAVAPVPAPKRELAPDDMGSIGNSKLAPGSYEITDGPGGVKRMHHVIGAKPEHNRTDPGKLDNFALNTPQKDWLVDGEGGWHILHKMSSKMPVRRFIAKEVPGGVLCGFSAVRNNRGDITTCAESLAFVPGVKLDLTAREIVPIKTQK